MLTSIPHLGYSPPPKRCNRHSRKYIEIKEHNNLLNDLDLWSHLDDCVEKNEMP